MNEQIVWVDAVRCTGCGACIDACPVQAMGLIDGKARVDEQACTGCGICMDACPEEAIRPVIQGELIPAPQRPAPTVYRPSPLVETAGAGVVATAPNPENARRFFDYLRTREAQDVLGRFGNYPVIAGAALPAGGVDVPSEQVIEVDFRWSAENRSRILDTFQEVTQAEPAE